MSKLVGGKVAGVDLPINEKGAFVRKASVFKNKIGINESVYKPERNRYHLYVSLACPWAHRTLIVRKLQKLDNDIGISIVHHHLDSQGWRFRESEPEDPNDISEGTVDHVHGYKRLRQLYFKTNEDYEGRFTVPVLWDTKTETIVNNESSEIIRILPEFSQDLNDHSVDLYPKELRNEIDEINDWVYDNINNGVYKSGFASTQEAYDEAVTNVFKHLDKVEALLEKKYKGKDSEFYYLVGDQLTEADIRLYPTIIRFDPVYHQHFKCNIRIIRHDYPYINKWAQKLYWKNNAFKSTTDFDHIKLHYTKSHPSINPLGITPLGPLPHILPLE